MSTQAPSGPEFWTRLPIGAVEAKGLNENAEGEQNVGHCLVNNTTCLGPCQGELPVLLFNSSAVRDDRMTTVTNIEKGCGRALRSKAKIVLAWTGSPT